LKSVKHWPSISDYAATYARYCFIPMVNCTAWSQATATLLHAAGVPADRFFVAKFNYDMSWIVEHWVMAFNVNNRWYTLDPQTNRYDNVRSLKKFGPGAYFARRHKGYDFEKPFEAVLLPGSRIKRVPYCGDPALLKKMIVAKTVPQFFIDHKNFDYSFSCLVSRATGNAKVISVSENRVRLNVVSSYRDERTGKMKTDKKNMDVNFKNGRYTIGKAGEYQHVGKVDPDGKRLSLSGEQSGITFTVK